METAHITLIAGGALFSFLLAAFIGKKIIPWLHKLNFGQSIREIGPSWHKEKQGTPTMGGLIFISAFLTIFIICLVIAQLFLNVKITAFISKDLVRLFGGIFMALCFALIGFADDYISIVKKRNKGLSAGQKLFAQILVAVGYALALYITGNTYVHIPFYPHNDGMVNFGVWFIPFCAFVAVSMTNAVNLTDGIDGLCGSVSFIVVLFFTVASAIIGQRDITNALVGSTLAGAIAGFLVWNLFPAKVFMGDIGSLFLGGIITALAFGINRPLLLVPVGIIYIIETISVILQVLYFKATGGKRLFKMAPIHHHYEMKGWSEKKIVTIFSSITIVGCLVAAALLIFG